MRIISFVLLLIQALDAGAKKHHDSIDTTTSYPSITITVWTGNNCNPTGAGGSLQLHMNLTAVNDNDALYDLYGSYRLSRDLVSTERLDWSTCPDNSSNCDNVGDTKGPCRSFRLCTSPDSNDNSLLANTCYLLDPQVSVSHLHVGRVHALRTLRTDTCISSA